MKLMLDSIILFGQNISKLKKFYVEILGLEIIEETESEWVLLNAGNCQIGLHRVGMEFRIGSSEDFKVNSNTKLVFNLDEDINEVRNRLLKAKVFVKEIKTFKNYDFWICDGEDPEGNVFQLKQKKNNEL
jgi:catechol 2,3-dioxygenase-like lactoylglutathione lyase family enzyme